MNSLRIGIALALGLAAGCGGSEKEACGGDGVICTYIGNGEEGLGKDGEAALDVSLYWPQDLTFGPNGQPYVVDWNNHRIRTLKDGKVETVIGTGYLGDALDGPAREASLNHPTHVSFDSKGRLIMSAWHNSKVMRYDFETDMIESLCGTGMRDYAGDDGQATKAILDLPVATAFDRDGRMLIMDQANQRIRRIDDSDVITTIVGPNKMFVPTPTDPAGLVPVCLTDAMSGQQNCKLCDMTDAAKDQKMCAPHKPQGFLGDGGPGDQVLMYQPFSQMAPPAGRMEMGQNGTLFFCDTGNHRIRALDADGTVRTVAGSGPAEFDRNYKGGHAGDGGPATKAQLRSPVDVAVGKHGALYIADTGNSCIRKVDSKGVISTIAGQCGHQGWGGDGGNPKDALLNQPYGITVHDGDLYIADTHNNRIRVVYGVE